MHHSFPIFGIRKAPECHLWSLSCNSSFLLTSCGANVGVIHGNPSKVRRGYPWKNPGYRQRRTGPQEQHQESPQPKGKMIASGIPSLITKRYWNHEMNYSISTYRGELFFRMMTGPFSSTMRATREKFWFASVIDTRLSVFTFIVRALPFFDWLYYIMLGCI